MYKITIQTLTGSEHTIYVPGNDEYILTSAVLSLSVGSAGEFNFTIPLGNPRYNEIVDHSIVTVYEDNAEIWRGDIQDIKQNFDKSLNVYCLEDMAWLGECAVEMTAITNQTYGQRFSAAIATYNADQVAKRQFTAGMLTSITTTNMCTWQPQYEEDLLSCLRNYIADDGYVRIRREYNGGTLTRYVDIVKLSDYGQQADQKIEFGSNLLDFVKEMDNTNFLNVIYPYGKETETPLYGEIMQRIVGTPIQNDASIAAFGRRERSVVFETDSLARLNSLAQSYLNRYSQPNMKIEVKAVDLGNIEIVNRIHLGDSVRIIASSFGIDQWSYATKQKFNMIDIADNQITLADAVRVQSLTSQVIEQAQEIKDAQTPASVLDEAKRNAWAIFEGDNGGIVTFDVNGNEQIVGIHIANNLDLSQATKAWGWNVNGLVYLHRTYPSDEWQVGIAMTMDGQIVADYITTGTLSADIIKTGTLNAALANIININASNITSGKLSADLIEGGVLTLGGNNNQYGTMLVYNGTEDESETYTIDQQGMGLIFTLDERNAGDLFINVISTSGSLSDYVGYVEINNAFYCALRLGLNHILLYNAGDSFDFVVYSYSNELSFKLVYKRANTTISKNGVVASNIDAIGGQIGDLNLDNGELYHVGKYIITDYRDFSISQHSLAFTQIVVPYFVPASFYLQSSFQISIDYTISNLIDMQDHRYIEFTLNEIESDGTITEIDLFQVPLIEGSHSDRFDVVLSNTDSRKYTIRLTDYGGSTTLNISARPCVNNIHIVSLSEEGIYGVFKGTVFGIGNFDSVNSSYNIVKSNSSSDSIEISSVDNNIHRFSSGTEYLARWQTPSDERVKEDITELNSDLSLSLIDATQPKRFKFKNIDGIHYGMIAQETRKLLDDLGESDSRLEFSLGNLNVDDQRAIEYEEYIPHLINYVKDLRAEITALKNIINTLKEDK